MAKPPEPLEEVLPHAALVVVASVKRVVATGPALAPLPPTGQPKSDRGAGSPEQTLELEVERVLRGAHDAREVLTVTKPVAPYAVREGTRGAWLVDASGVVLGRYGPDSWRVSHVEAALTEG